MLFDYYRKLFLDADHISWGEETETITRYWDNGTLSLYFTLVVFVMLIGINLYNKQTVIVARSLKNNTDNNKSINLQLRVVFAILLFFLGFRHRSVGIDTIVYTSTIENVVSLPQLFNDSTTEPLYKLFQYVLHLTFNNGAIGIFIYSFFTIYFIYCGLKKNERNISLFICLITYFCLYYFQSFNLLRLSLAASAIFYNFNCLLEEKYKRFTLVIILVSFLHYSTLVMFLPFGLYIIYKKHRKIALICISLLLIAIIFASTSLGDYLAIINRYSGYIDSNESGGHIGIMLFLDYFPCIIICFYIIRKKIRNVWADLMICFTSSAITIRLMAYFISIAGRLHTHFMPLTMILLPYWIFYLKRNNSPFYKPMVSLCILWSFFRLHIYFCGYLSTDGIMPYRFLWND